MRKFSGLIILIFSAVIATVFFALLNCSLLLNENRIKSILDESNFYETAALYVQSEVVAKSGLQLNEGTNFEDINHQINEETIKNTIDNSVSSVVTILNGSEANKMFPVEFTSLGDGENRYSFEKYADLNNNSLVDIASKRKTYLLMIALTVTLSLLAGMMIYSNTAKGRLYYIGIFGVTGAILLAVTIYLIREYTPFLLDQFANQSSLVREAKLLAGAKRIISVVIDKQTIFYIAETISLLLVSMTVFTIKKIIAREELGEIDKKI